MIKPSNVAQQQMLDRNAEDADRDRRKDERCPITNAQRVQQKPRAKGTEHILRAMREIDDVQQPKDHRQAEAQHRVKRTVDESDEELGKQRRRRRYREIERVEHAAPSPPAFTWCAQDSSCAYPLTRGHWLGPWSLKASSPGITEICL